MAQQTSTARRSFFRHAFPSRLPARTQPQLARWRPSLPCPPWTSVDCLGLQCVALDLVLAPGTAQRRLQKGPMEQKIKVHGTNAVSNSFSIDGFVRVRAFCHAAPCHVLFLLAAVSLRQVVIQLFPRSLGGHLRA